MAMTDKEYRKKLDQLIRAYLKMRTIATEMREAGYMYPIGLGISPHSDPYIQFAEMDKTGGLEYQTDYPLNEEHKTYSVERQSIRLLYLE